MATYIKPQVLVYQEFQATPSAGDTDLRAWIVGPNSVTHKRGAESIGDYADVPNGGIEVEIPGLQPGSVLDEESVKVCVDDALLEYAHVAADVLTDEGGFKPDTKYVYNQPDTSNRLVANFSLADYKNHQRAEIFGNRDIQPGDTVVISGYAAAIPGVTQCENVTFETKVLGLSVEELKSEIGKCVRKSRRNSEYTYVPEYTITATKTVGDTTTSITGDFGAYAGVMAEEVYTLSIVIDGEKKYYTVDSASGLDSYPSMAPLPDLKDGKYLFAVGRKGITLTLTEAPTESAVYTINIVAQAYEPASAYKRLDPKAKDTEIEQSALNDPPDFELDGIYDPKPTGWLKQKYWITVIGQNKTNSCENVEFKIVSQSGLDDTPKVQAVVRDDKYEFEIAHGTDYEHTVVAKFSSEVFDKIQIGQTWLYEFTGPYAPTVCSADGYYTGEDDDTYIVTCVTSGIVGDTEDVPQVVIQNRTGTVYLGPVDATTEGVTTSTGVHFSFTEQREGQEAVEAQPEVPYKHAIALGDWIIEENGEVRFLESSSSVVAQAQEADVVEGSIALGDWIVTDGSSVRRIALATDSVRQAQSEDVCDEVAYQAAVEAKAAVPASYGDMALNDTWMVRVKSAKNGAVNGIVLVDSVPEEIRTVGKSYIPLDVRFCVSKDIEIDTFELNGTKIKILNGIEQEVEGITKRDGAPKRLPLISGKMSVAYNEWSASGAGCLNYIANVEELDRIPGDLDPSNTLKYGVYKALSNSNGTTVVYTPVVGDSLDAWNDAFGAGVGSREVYTLVPLTQDIQVLNLAAAVITSDSNEETCAWKNGFFNVAAPTSIMRIGKSDSTLHATSLDGEKVFATITEDGFVEITSKVNGRSNASLDEVKPGDELRVFGISKRYVSYIIDSVEGDTMKVRGIREAVDIPTSIEVWHHFNRDEQVNYICEIAQSFSNRRIKLVWPDVVGEGTWELPGTMLCAALAGMSSGILPNQSMTRVSLGGFDDLTRSLGYFTDTQIKRLAASGVWCVIEDQDGTVYTMHALTTDTLSVQYSEEMMTRIVDGISFRIRDLLDMYIGTTNVTNETIESIEQTLYYFLGDISAANYNAMGPLVTDFRITDISQDSLLLDRINVSLELVVVKCTNYIAVHIQAS